MSIGIPPGGGSGGYPQMDNQQTEETKTPSPFEKSEDEAEEPEEGEEE